MHKLDIRLQKISSEIWKDIAAIDELKGRWSAGANLHPQVLTRLKRSVLITSTGSSTRIEGALLSDEDIEKLMRGISIEKFKDRDVQEVKGYFELLQNIFDSWQNLTFSESSIKHFHKEMLKYVQKDIQHRGNYKTMENKVHMIDEKGQSIGVLFDTTPVYLTSIAMQELVEWTQKAMRERLYHPILTIGNFIVEFLQIHPFQDGNGRLSRILTNLLLLKEGYLYIPYISHEKLIEDNKPDYYLALRSSQKTFNYKSENIISWLQFFVKIILRQSQMAVDLLTFETVEKILSPIQLRVWNYMQKVTEASPLEIAKNTSVARPTINQVLNKLLKLNKVERIGLGRSTRYRLI
ncbi:MAG: Filamentation induced by cAMP protein Fic [Candidatus Gottesmanbacteria bacterium GW2011_GWC2_39_8]|uniref:Filamentation induced by cAMP protein Fic n=1 Tax=Candidatus Gottesmanbacteria bacterium GW2011_GWC2_39_8 TaxID=1618450 RepID=A0A0G0Q1L6_9BACT|nr:MAG: Filamentation induced by cAMP protein Fic [Candidatus Gottesmanbacteria bacterium GW2011_GWC2_39_8]